MSEPIVYLIGAGPGNPDLITVRGLQCLAEADVVLYDHLVHPRLLRSAKPTAEKIDVGMPAPTPLDQEAICYLLADKAVEGKVVARLKWGDPFIFDSGGSEALFLHEGREIFVTFSAGVSLWRDGEPLEAAMERADGALYEAKRTGKNRTCLA